VPSTTDSPNCGMMISVGMRAPLAEQKMANSDNK